MGKRTRGGASCGLAVKAATGARASGSPTKSESSLTRAAPTPVAAGAAHFLPRVTIEPSLQDDPETLDRVVAAIGDLLDADEAG